MKILKGRLRETLYAWPCQAENPTPCCKNTSSLYPNTKHTCSGRGNLGPASLQVIRSTVYQPEQVTYMSDRLGLHRVENASDTEVAISLHLYTVSCPWRTILFCDLSLTFLQPPNAAKHGCHIFDESTGKKSLVQQCHFYSELGVKM